MARHLTYTNYSAGARRKNAVTVAALCLILLIGLGSAVSLLAQNDYDIRKAMGMRTETESSTDEMGSTLPAMAVIAAPKDVYRYLVLCGDDGGDLAFMAEIHITLSSGHVGVDAVSPGKLLEYNGSTVSVAEMFRQYSYDLVRCYNANSEAAFDNYFRISTSRFKKLMAELGPIIITIDHDIPYVVEDTTYTFRRGENSLTSDLLLKYLTLSARGEQLLVNQEAVFCTLLQTHFTQALADGGEDYFSDFITYFTTDVSIYDYRAAADYVNTFLRSSPIIEPVY